MWKNFLLAILVVLVAAGCGGGGDINIQPSNSSVVNNTGGGGGSSANANVTTASGGTCASYMNSAGQRIQATTNGNHCVYSPSFLAAGNPLLADMTLRELPGNGAHMFSGSLFVGRNFDSNASLATAGIREGGDGPTLTVEAGATLAFASQRNFVIINRGSRLLALGTRAKPITFTSFSDVNGTITNPEAVQQWGGMVINGFGVSNKCSYTGTRGQPGFAASGECHVLAEGAAGLDESHYGGDNDGDSSGRLEYVIIKHTGAQVANGDELNGISFGGVGSNTIVRNLQVYSTYDDGIEMFGGSVSFENFVAIFVRDDAIDIDEGWNGSITNALVIQSEGDGNHCIEADGLGSFSSLNEQEVEAKITQQINSRPSITNLTCIISPNGGEATDIASAGGGRGTHDPGAGWRFREGVFPTITDSMVISSWGDDSSASNYCLRLDNRTATEAAKTSGRELTIENNLFACEDEASGMVGTMTVAAWARAGNMNQFASLTAKTDPTATANTDLMLLGGTPPIFSLPFAMMMIGSAAVTIDDPDAAADPDDAEHIGGILAASNWAAGWTYGIFDGSRAQALWFE